MLLVPYFMLTVEKANIIQPSVLHRYVGSCRRLDLDVHGPSFDHDFSLHSLRVHLAQVRRLDARTLAEAILGQS